MEVTKAVNCFLDYHKVNAKKKYNKESSIYSIITEEVMFEILQRI